jgi:hypothetical protein
MKNIFLVSFILALGCSASFAQNSVTVTQEGNGNKATISQGDTDSSKQGAHTSCDEARKKSGPENSITVQTSGKTVIDTTDTSVNRYQGVIGDGNELSAFQFGSANNLSLLLPDPSSADNIFAAYQNGSDNMLSAILNSSHQNLNVSQSGNGNSVAINPCGSTKE